MLEFAFGQNAIATRTVRITASGTPALGTLLGWLMNCTSGWMPSHGVTYTL